jgi:hypothetical protein
MPIRRLQGSQETALVHEMACLVGTATYLVSQSSRGKDPNSMVSSLAYAMLETEGRPTALTMGLKSRDGDSPCRRKEP